LEVNSLGKIEYQLDVERVDVGERKATQKPIDSG
jgi:hypothetical protein